MQAPPSPAPRRFRCGWFCVRERFLLAKNAALAQISLPRHQNYDPFASCRDDGRNAAATHDHRKVQMKFRACSQLLPLCLLLHTRICASLEVLWPKPFAVLESTDLFVDFRTHSPGSVCVVLLSAKDSRRLDHCIQHAGGRARLNFVEVLEPRSHWTLVVRLLPALGGGAAVTVLSITCAGVEPTSSPPTLVSIKDALQQAVIAHHMRAGGESASTSSAVTGSCTHRPALGGNDGHIVIDIAIWECDTLLLEGLVCLQPWRNGETADHATLLAGTSRNRKK